MIFSTQKTKSISKNVLFAWMLLAIVGRVQAGGAFNDYEWRMEHPREAAEEDKQNEQRAYDNSLQNDYRCIFNSTTFPIKVAVTVDNKNKDCFTQTINPGELKYFNYRSVNGQCDNFVVCYSNYAHPVAFSRSDSESIINNFKNIIVGWDAKASAFTLVGKK